MDRPAQGPRIVGVSDINFNLFIANFSRSIYGTPQFVISINTTHTHTETPYEGSHSFLIIHIVALSPNMIFKAQGTLLVNT